MHLNRQTKHITYQTATTNDNNTKQVVTINKQVELFIKLSIILIYYYLLKTKKTHLSRIFFLILNNFVNYNNNQFQLSKLQKLKFIIKLCLQTQIFHFKNFDQMLRLLNNKIKVTSYDNRILYYISRSQFYDKLQEIHGNENFLMKISQQTRIYPSYFSKQNLKQFFMYKDFEKYKKYVQISKRKYINPSSLVSQLFAQFSSYKSSISLMECYFNWLLTVKLCKGSDEYFKNKLSMQLFDMRNPQGWFPVSQGRHFIYHHGPTNSGKTSSAIKQLKQLSKDKKGVYMAPLRLLAWQMQQKLGNCNLITGQDKQFRVSNLTSCTIQAVSISQQYDVAIIDQIQLIGDNQRGWSWTKAILSINAKRIHLCGDQRALNLVSKLVKSTKGTLQQRRYSRLGKFISIKGKLRLIHTQYDISDITKGDCLIQFSVQAIHRLRGKINDVINDRQINLQQNNSGFSDEPYVKQEQQKCSQVAVIYGKLPPQCRKQQARKFNQEIAPYLVATNAIGMGLNLNIKKIIFAGFKRKNKKGEQVQLEQHEIQQIAGRAGRGTQDGFVQCMSFDVLKKVRNALRNVNKTYGINLEDVQVSDQIKQNQQDEADPLKILPTSNNVQNLATEFYDEFLKRNLTQKERKIQQAGLFIQYIFLKRTIISLEYYYGQKISLSKAARYFLQLSLVKQNDFVLSQKMQLLEWVQKLQQYGFQLLDLFEIAKGLSLNYNSDFCKRQVLSYALQFKQKQRVNIPKQLILKRNKQKCHNYEKLNILQGNYSLLQIYIYMWNKYEFIFWDVETAKSMKQDITQLIKEVLQDEKGFKSTRSYERIPKINLRLNQDINNSAKDQQSKRQKFKF